MSTPPPTNVLAAPPRSPATPKAPRAARDGDDAGGTRVVRELGGGVRQVISTGEGSASSRGRVSCQHLKVLTTGVNVCDTLQWWVTALRMALTIRDDHYCSGF